MDNLVLYNELRSAPPDALREISAGRLRGKTDINPMWRIKALTERFGPCGVGWRYVITKQWTEMGAGGEIAAFCNIDLYYRWEGQWSEPIPGTGGSAFIAKEKAGLYTSDECYKMALTDAISVAAKALGVAADVYWAKDATKYDRPEQRPIQPLPESEPPRCQLCGTCIGHVIGKSGKPMHPDVYAAAVIKKHGRILCPACVTAMETPIAPPVV